MSLYGDRAALPLLRQGLRASDAWIRWENASCLNGYGDLRSAREVLRLYASETDPSVRKEMVRALAGVEYPTVKQFLVERLHDREVEIRLAATYTLGSLPPQGSQSILKAHLRRERSPEIRREIRDTLTTMPTVEAG